jgi:hypothetical protein
MFWTPAFAGVTALGNSNEVEPFLQWERHLAAIIVAGSHSHKNSTSLAIGWRCTP